MLERQTRSRRLVLLLAVAATVAVAASVVAGWKHIVDRYLLHLLARAPAGAMRERLLVRLVERRCAAVTPHLLQHHRERPLLDHPGSPLVERSRRVEELVSLGTGVIPFLTDVEVRGLGDLSLAFDVLERLGTRARSALPDIVRFLEGDRADSWWSVEAMEVIGAMGEVAAAAVPTLLAFRRHQDRIVRSQLYDTLGRIGPRARDAAPLLLDALTFESGEPLFRAARALDRLEPGRPETRAALAACVAGDDLHASQAAAALLEETAGR